MSFSVLLGRFVRTVMFASLFFCLPVQGQVLVLPATIGEQLVTRVMIGKSTLAQVLGLGILAGGLSYDHPKGLSSSSVVINEAQTMSALKVEAQQSIMQVKMAYADLDSHMAHLVSRLLRGETIVANEYSDLLELTRALGTAVSATCGFEGINCTSGLSSWLKLSELDMPMEDSRDHVEWLLVLHHNTYLTMTPDPHDPKRENGWNECNSPKALVSQLERSLNQVPARKQRIALLRDGSQFGDSSAMFYMQGKYVVGPTGRATGTQSGYVVELLHNIQTGESRIQIAVAQSHDDRVINGLFKAADDVEFFANRRSQGLPVATKVIPANADCDSYDGKLQSRELAQFMRQLP